MAQIQQIAGRTIPSHLEASVAALCQVAERLATRISAGGLEDNLAANVGANTDGDTQKALDVIADEAFESALHGTGVRWYASEEQEDAVEIDTDGRLAIAIDPLDGSSNIDVNVSIGTIFSIQPSLEDPLETFLRPGHHIEAAGYFIYGPQTVLMISFGDGVRKFVLDRAANAFQETPAPALPDPERTAEFAINASNYRHWSLPIRAYIDDCLAGTNGPRGKNFNMRWVASLVAETHRIITRGGIFLYPSDARNGYQHGRLRLVYECAPIAFLIEQSGGKATNSLNRILDLTPDSLHVRTPFVFGTSDKVERVATYHDLPEQEVSALFGNRGLFRA